MSREVVTSKFQGGSEEAAERLDHFAQPPVMCPNFNLTFVRYFILCMFRFATKSIRYHRSPSLCSSRPIHVMNRPRNRQPRPGRDNKTQTLRNQPRNSPRPSYSNVPNSQQVIPGAAVSIVLKQDQPTGHEVQGEVQYLLSRGDHPRGIKVRLTDGRIGRVQRMASDTSSPATSTPQTDSSSYTVRHARSKGRRQEVEDVTLQEPPPRTLGDYLSHLEDNNAQTTPAENPAFSSATIKCHICGNFEGDEAAVSHHIEEHLD